MIEMLTELARAECTNCKTGLRLYWGDLSGPHWSHAIGGKATCPNVPTADPDLATLTKSIDAMPDEELAKAIRRAAGECRG